MSDDVKPTAARVWFYLTGFAIALAAWIPWFSFTEPRQQATVDVSLLRDVTCSAFVLSADPCRAHWFGGLELAWALVPIFLVTRLVACVALVVLFSTLSGRVSPRAGSRIALVAILVFAVFIAAVPGDQSYRAVEPTWGALFGVGGAISIFLHTTLTPLAQATRDERRITVAGTLAAVLALSGSLWFSIVAEPEAISPEVPANQSAYTYGAIAKRFYWHDLRFGREHYLEHPFGDPDHPIARALDDRTLRFGLAVAASGLFLATCALLAARARSTQGSIRRLVIGGVALLGTTIAFTVHLAKNGRQQGLVPAAGAVTILLALVCVGWMCRPRRVKP
jgi:hypothetical protein